MDSVTPPTTPPEVAASSLGGASGADTPDRLNLTPLRDAVNLSQRAVLIARRAPTDRAGLRTAREAQLLAMSRYEQVLTLRRLPIPRRLHQETRLLRRLLG